MRIVIELDSQEAGDDVVVRVSRKGGEAEYSTESAAAAENAGAAPADILDATDVVEVADAGPAPKSAPSAGEDS